MSSRSSNAYAVFRIRDFKLFIAGRFLLTIALQMQAVIVGWQVYEITNDPWSLGLIGLAEAIPFLSLALFAGHVADSVPRKPIVLVNVLIYSACAILLLFITADIDSIYPRFGLAPFFSVIFLTGLARAFLYPALIALMAQIVPRELYVSSSTWNSTTWHIAAVTGPALGGLIYGFLGIYTAYSLVVLLSIISFVVFLNLRAYVLPVKQKAENMKESLLTGLRFVFRNQVILGALTLDMFAVLFGGAVAMLPVFAGEILHVGPQGLGILRAAPAAGAVVMALFLAYNPPLRRAGTILFTSVAGFGMCIILFALSGNFILSIILLALSGAFDNVSVIIRHSIIQLYTPDEMRGRVASVNSIFIGSSNEIGSFESGAAAKLLGLIPSVIFGGSVTLIVVAVTAGLAPVLRRLDLRHQVYASDDTGK